MSSLSLLFCVVVFLAAGWARADKLHTVESNKRGLQKLEEEDPAAAEKHFLKALGEDPFNPILRLNLGWTFELQKQYEKALKEYEAVVRAGADPAKGVVPEVLFVAHFNAGNAAAQLKNIPLALRHYQAALEVQPDSIETKTNIELLMQAQQQGQGGGEGDPKDPNDDKGQGDKPNKPNDRGDKPNQKPEFDSKNLTKEDVRKILEELKSQEQKIRALEYGTKGKESAPEKDW